MIHEVLLLMLVDNVTSILTTTASNEIMFPHVPQNGSLQLAFIMTMPIISLLRSPPHNNHHLQRHLYPQYHRLKRLQHHPHLLTTLHYKTIYYQATCTRKV